MDATNVASVAATARTSGQSICMVPPRFVTGSLRRQVDELFRFLAEEPDCRGRRAELVALAEHGEHPAQPRVRLQPGVRWTRRRGWRTRPEERAQHPAEHGYPGTPQAFQIRSAYSLMLRSEENFPMCAMLRMAIRVQRSGSRNVLPTRSWHSAYDWKSASSMYVSCSSSE